MILLRLARWIGLAFLAVTVMVLGGWSALAIWFRFDATVPMRDLLAGIVVLLTVLAAVCLATSKRWIALAIYSAFFAAMLVWWSTVTPSNDRDSLCCANIAPAVACQPVEGSTDPDGCWHTEACHPEFSTFASNLCFDLLTGQSPGERSPSNDGFVSIHCSLNEASPVVARMTLPAHATMPFDGCNMLIALRRPASSSTRNRCRRAVE